MRARVTLPRQIVPDVRRVWTSSMAARVLAVLCVMAVNYNLTLGVLLLAGGGTRLQGQSFAVIRNIGGHTPWGVALIVVAVVMVAGVARSCRLLAVGLAIAALLHLAVAASFVAAAIALPEAAVTGPPSYLLIGGAHAVVAGYHWFAPAREGR